VFVFSDMYCLPPTRSAVNFPSQQHVNSTWHDSKVFRCFFLPASLSLVLQRVASQVTLFFLASVQVFSRVRPVTHSSHTSTHRPRKYAAEITHPKPSLRSHRTVAMDALRSTRDWLKSRFTSNSRQGSDSSESRKLSIVSPQVPPPSAIPRLRRTLIPPTITLSDPPQQPKLTQPRANRPTSAASPSP
jgi:hypothetical protein